MAGRNWRDESRYRDDNWREGSRDRDRSSYEGSDYYGRSAGRDYGRGDLGGRGRDEWTSGGDYGRGRSYQGGDWGSDRGGGTSNYGQDYSRDVRRDNYSDVGYGESRDTNPFGSNRAYEYDDWNRGAGRSSGRDYFGRERGGAFWNSDADNRRDWDLNRRSWQGQDYGRGYGGRERSFWDRASDEVSSWFGDEDAERRRRDDHCGRGPRNYTRSSDRIREDVNDRLTDDWRVDASDVDVTVSGTEVTLSGTVTNREQRRRAEDIAESISGVSHVQNNLRVKNQEQSWSGSTTDRTQGSTGGVGTLGSSTSTSTPGGVGGVGSTGKRT
ncbi:MAG: BON domain-containing protein [Methylobacteriaceae bacterium]|nr:BON domain-containing protein [Methylobacteriaceae bacterium]